MRKILFAFSALTLAFAFSFCAKEPVTSVETTATTEFTNQSVSDRSPCIVTIAATGQVRVCGLATSGNACQDCQGNAGFEGVGTNLIYNVDVNGAVPFSITNLTAGQINVTVTTTSGTINFKLQPGQCKQLAEYNCAIVTTP